MTRLKNVRVAAGHTLVSLSVATGGKLKPSRIGNYDNGSRKIPLDAAEILARALNVTPGYLMGMGEESALDGSFDALSPEHKELYAVIQRISSLSPEKAEAGTAILRAYLRSISKE
tara:strand:+ start:96 stop:443 length:348 start_codon:yes stop_codon:yes gene_type:complete